MLSPVLQAWCGPRSARGRAGAAPLYAARPARLGHCGCCSNAL